MTTGEPRETTRKPALDGVRGLAILMVLAGHALSPWAGGSFAAAGVTLFFALSGYLITGLLRGEFERRGRIDLRRFYARRMTRLAPPLLVMLIATGPIMQPGWGAILPAITWTGNYADLAGVHTAPYGHTWSLATEEQFYLLWPLLFALLMRRSHRAVRTLTWTVAGLMIWRSLVVGTAHLHYGYEALETAGSAILLGCLVSLAGWRLARRWAAISLGAMVGIAAGVAAIDKYAVLWLTVPLAVTPFAAALVASAGACRWLTWRPLTLLGVASYSIYLWHVPVSFFVSGDLTPVGVIGGSAVGLVAYRLVEAPLMRWRSKAAQTRSASDQTLGCGATLQPGSTSTPVSRGPVRPVG